jgi:hypothetical protein
VPDDQHPTALRMAQHTRQPHREPSGRLVIILPTRKSTVVPPGPPVRQHPVMHRPGLRITPPVKLPNVQLTQFLNDRHRTARALDDDLGSLHSTAQRRYVYRDRGGQPSKLPAERSRLGYSQVSQRVISDPVRQLTRMLISQVMPVTDIPSGHTSHQASPLSNTLGIMRST